MSASRMRGRVTCLETELVSSLMLNGQGGPLERVSVLGRIRGGGTQADEAGGDEGDDIPADGAAQLENQP